MIISLSQVIIYFLIFARLLGVIFFAPVFNHKAIFFSIKVAFLFWVSLMVLFVVPLPDVIPSSPIVFLCGLLVEFFLGALIGFTMTLIIHGVEYAGSIMDNQAGLSVASMLDPSTGQNAALLEQLLKLIVLIIFLSLEGHLVVLSILFQSYDLFPVGQPLDLTHGLRLVITFAKDLFLIGFKLASPIIIVVFFIDFCFGLLNRVAEQVNVFQLGFQVKPITSLFIFLAVIPGFVYAISNFLDLFIEHEMNLLSVLRLTNG